MTLAHLKAHGSGRLAFALVIEGWPHIFVSDKRLTLATDKANRTVIAGLLTEGIRFTERAYPGEGKLDCSNITFRFRPPYGTRTSSGTTDPITQSFARRGTAVGSLGGNLSSTALTITLVGASTLSNNTYYYLGTETIRTATSPTIARAAHASYAQKHNITYIEGQREVSIYDYPTTIDGRRVTLYCYGRGDDVATLSGDNVIWRGIVAMPPRLERTRDGVTWSLQCYHAIHAWRQTLVAEEVALKVVGIYHESTAPILTRIIYEGSVSESYFLGGFHATTDALTSDVTDDLGDALTDVGATSTNVENLTLIYDPSIGRYKVFLHTGSSPPSELLVSVTSPIVGSTTTHWFDRFGNEVETTELEADETYYNFLEPTGEVVVPYSDHPAGPVSPLGGARWQQLRETDPDLRPAADDPVRDFSPQRLYIDHDWSTVTGTGSEANFLLHIDASTVEMKEEWQQGIPGGGVPGGTLAVTGSGYDATALAYYVEVDTGAGFRGFINRDTVIRPVVNYSESGATTDFAEFLENVIDRRVDADDGITPFLTPDEFDTTAELEGNVPDWIRDRTYSFVSSASIEEVMSHELLLSGHMLYVNEDAKISFRQIPVFTNTAVTEKAVDATKIITPAGSYGSWPGYELQPQGIVATVRFKQGYDPAADEWKGTTYELREPDLIARHKKRGVGVREIAPKSNPVVEPDPQQILADLRMVAGNLFAFMGREYAAVRVEVPFDCYDYVLGDVVTLTSKHVPEASDGSTGVTGKRAVVMGRSWDFDGAREEWGELELWILLDAPSGYAPSGIITGQTDNGGDEWELEFLHAGNAIISTNLDGLVMQNFAAGDYIEICKVDSDGSDDVTGRIVGDPTTGATEDGCTVQLDDTWTPGSDQWSLEFQSDNGSTAQAGQRLFVYVADNDKKLATGVQARQFT